MYAEIPNCSIENRNKNDMTHLIGQSRMALLLHNYINDTFSHMHCSFLLFHLSSAFDKSKNKHITKPYLMTITPSIDPIVSISIELLPEFGFTVQDEPVYGPGSVFQGMFVLTR